MNARLAGGAKIAKVDDFSQRYICVRNEYTDYHVTKNLAYEFLNLFSYIYGFEQNNGTCRTSHRSERGFGMFNVFDVHMFSFVEYAIVLMISMVKFARIRPQIFFMIPT